MDVAKLPTCLEWFFSSFNPFSLILKEPKKLLKLAMLASATYVVWDERRSSQSGFTKKRYFTLLLDDKIWLSWHEKLSFKLPTICIIYGTSQTGPENNFFRS